MSRQLRKFKLPFFCFVSDLICVFGYGSFSHCVAHNFEVVIYEENSRCKLGGIWAHVNSTSGLQLNSMLYRFHPAVLWRKAFPQQKDIVAGELADPNVRCLYYSYVGLTRCLIAEITRIWKEYGLESRTKFEVSENQSYVIISTHCW